MKLFIHKLPLWMILLWVPFFSCEQEDPTSSSLHGTIRFGGMSLEFTPMGSQGSRITGSSPWVHVFPNSADLVFIDKATGQQYVLEYNPNDFSAPYTIALPYGEYEYYSVVDGGIFSAFLPFEARGEFPLDRQSLEISLEAATEYGLVTVKDHYVEKASISDGEQEPDLVKHQDCNYWFLYVKGGTKTTLNIREFFQGSTITRELDIEANRHYNFVLKLNEGAATITGLILAPFELEEEEILIGWSTKFFEENGTIKCPRATPGEKGMVGDKVYEAVDRSLLIQRRDEGADLSCVCTSLVTDLSSIFEESISFNQPIGNWDVSNVTNMSSIFRSATSFNQPISNWDVSNVTNMTAMFQWTEYFDQPIGNWDVSNVTNMSGIFAGAENFNHPIGDWDVSNVTEMDGMFIWAERFNQPIGNWDVSNGTNMSSMFAGANDFNQPLGDWDVSKVTDMSYMFSSASNFNQDLSSWCVRNIPSDPTDFSTESALAGANKPVWGTCPE